MNPYQKVLADAERDIEEKWARVAARDNWYDNPLRFVDVEDIFDENGLMRSRRTIKNMAYNSFYATRFGKVDRVEGELFYSLFHKALDLFRKKATKAQISALVMAREAEKNGLTASSYIAEQRGVNRHSAYKLLKRAEKALLETSGTENDIIKVEQDIKLRARELPRVCAVCGNVCEDSLKALCKVCHMRHVYNDEYLSDYHRHEVETSMRLSSFEHWRKARDLVME